MLRPGTSLNDAQESCGVNEARDGFMYLAQKVPDSSTGKAKRMYLPRNSPLLLLRGNAAWYVAFHYAGGEGRLFSNNNLV